MEIKPFKIRVNQEQSKIVQETLFVNGGSWYGGNTCVKKGILYLYFSSDKDNKITWSDKNDVKFFNDHPLPELTFEQFSNLYIKPINKEIIGYKLIKNYPGNVLEIGDEILNESYAEQFPEFWEPLYKSEPEYVPFAMSDYELFMGKTAYYEYKRKYITITQCDMDHVYFHSENMIYSQAIKHLKFTDGSPFGKKIKCGGRKYPIQGYGHHAGPVK